MKPSMGLTALAAAILAFAPARAARADEAADQQFKIHVQHAKIHYDLGEFADAAEEYIQAYRIKPVAGALFNIAQAYRQAGQYEKSRQFYNSYLRDANPDAKAKAIVQKQIKELNDLIAKEERTKHASPTNLEPPGGDELAPPPVASAKAAPATKSMAQPTSMEPPAAKSATVSMEPPVIAAPAKPSPAPVQVAIIDSHPKPAAAPATVSQPAPPASVRPTGQVVAQSGGRSHTLAYVAGGAAVLLLGGGIFFNIEAARADNELTAGAHTTADADTLISTSKTDHTVSAVLFAAGAAAAVGAGLLYFLPASGPSGGAGGSVGGHF